MTITLRTTKGSALSHAELDGNFTDLDTRVLALAGAYTSGSQVGAALDTLLGGTAWRGGTMTGSQIVAAIDTALGSTNWQLGGGGGSTTIVNDLTTGGTTAALSAQQGVVLKGQIDAKADSSTLASKANLASPALTGTPTAPTPTAGTNTTQIATTAFVSAAVSALVNASPAALDTLNELAAALGNDANFATTVNNAIALKANTASPTFTGPITSAGANIVPPTAMAALAIDVTKMDNTKSVSSASTFTLSATPGAGTVFGLELTNSGSTPLLMTLPAGTFFSRLRQAVITTFLLPANGRLNLFFKYDGTRYLVVGDPGPLNNFGAATGPTVNEDTADGYEFGSIFTTSAAAAIPNGVWVYTSGGVGAAVWTRLDTSGASGGITSTDQTGTTYTLALGDANAEVTRTNASANTTTVPTNATVAFPIGTVISVVQNGAGASTIAAAGGVTIVKPTARSLTTSGQHESATLVKTATDTWRVVVS